MFKYGMRYYGTMPRLTYDGKELSPREKEIFLTAIAIGAACAMTCAMGLCIILSLLGLI